MNNIRGKYIKDEDSNIISPITSSSTVFDADGKNLDTKLSEYLPLTGGTMTGDLILQPQVFLKSLDTDSNSMPLIRGFNDGVHLGSNSHSLQIHSYDYPSMQCYWAVSGTKSSTDYIGKTGTILYRNGSGSSRANITLNDSSANYNTIIVYFKNSDSLYSSSAITNGNSGSVSGTSITLSAVTLYNGNMYLKTATYNITGTNMTFGSCYEFKITAGAYPTMSTSSSAISVTTVIGYNQPFK